MPDIVILILTVPTITGVIGWVTNMAAVKMIFHPERFWGVGPIGWQAILVRHADKFATSLADMATEHLVSPRELVERLDPNEIEKMFAETVEICRESANVVKEGSWGELPDHVKTMIVTQVKGETKKTTEEIFNKLEGISDELLDLHQLVKGQLSGENTGKLSRLFKKIAKSELKFIEYYGGIFGFIIGCFQIGVWQAMQIWWLMPIVGVIVGLVTNWLAIQMIFRPMEPTKYLGLITYQGLFPKRQKEIARDYGETSGSEILTPKNVIRLVTQGEAGERIAKIVTETISERFATEWEKYKAMVPIEITPEMMSEVQAIIVRRIAAKAPAMQPELEDYLERKLDIANLVEERLGSMPKPLFERLLRGIFEEDELTLIIVGGFLGGAVGLLQGFIVLAL